MSRSVLTVSRVALKEQREHRETIMKLVFAFICMTVAVVSVHARPRYIAIPLDNVQLVEVDEYSAQPESGRALRIPRRAAYEEPDTEEDSIRFQRQAGGGGGGGGHDHVDYGAHTGHHGAFGWYADFPVHTTN